MELLTAADPRTVGEFRLHYGAFASTPAVADGLVFIGCTDDSLYALRA